MDKAVEIDTTQRLEQLLGAPAPASAYWVLTDWFWYWFLWQMYLKWSQIELLSVKINGGGGVEY